MTEFTINDAISIAVEAHRGQWDKGRPTLPYITHPMRVMSSFDDPVLQMIAILHDAVEDTPVTIGWLRFKGAPDRVIAGIEAMTHPEGESDEDYWARVRTNADALEVKLADVDDNSDPNRLALLPREDAERLSEKYARARLALTEFP